MLLNSNVAAIKLVYRFYVTHNVSSLENFEFGLKPDELRSMLLDTGVRDECTMQMGLVIKQCKMTRGGVPSVTDRDVTLSLQEFVESVVRFAWLQNKKTKTNIFDATKAFLTEQFVHARQFVGDDFRRTVIQNHSAHQTRQ